jgi:hypothetical protein
MSNVQKPASATAKVKKLLLFPGDPLIKTLKPDYYVIVDPSTLDVIFDSGITPDDEGDDGSSEGGDEDDGRVDTSLLKAPSLSDITLVSKKMVTDKNKNQYVEFVFNVKNSGGETVIGVEGYGQ